MTAAKTTPESESTWVSGGGCRGCDRIRFEEARGREQQTAVAVDGKHLPGNVFGESIQKFSMSGSSITGERSGVV